MSFVSRSPSQTYAELDHQVSVTVSSIQRDNIPIPLGLPICIQESSEEWRFEGMEVLKNGGSKKSGKGLIGRLFGTRKVDTESIDSLQINLKTRRQQAVLQDIEQGSGNRYLRKPIVICSEPAPAIYLNNYKAFAR